MKRILLVGFILLAGCKTSLCGNAVAAMDLETDEAKVQAYATCIGKEANDEIK